MSERDNPIHNAAFPRSNGYDADWVLSNQMGPNALWLVEWLTADMRLEPGMRVLDLGCGKALTSIFLAREYGVQVHAADLWVRADPNQARVQEQGLQDRIVPLRAEAHALPFARASFDAVISIDAYQYFGTDDLYLHYLSNFVKPGGQIGVVMPGLTQPIDGDVPPHLAEPQSHGTPFWEDECVCFHTADWWRAHWGRCGRVEVEAVDELPDGWRHWRDFEAALERAGKNMFPSCAEALDADGGRYIGFVRALAHRNEAEGFNLYDLPLELG
jgi:SAM-dependent methyltransferase